MCSAIFLCALISHLLQSHFSDPMIRSTYLINLNKTKQEKSCLPRWNCFPVLPVVVNISGEAEGTGDDGSDLEVKDISLGAGSMEVEAVGLWECDRPLALLTAPYETELNLNHLIQV